MKDKKKKAAPKKAKAPKHLFEGLLAEDIPTKLTEKAELKALDFLEKSWPHELSSDVEAAFEKLRSALSVERAEPVDIKGAIKTKTDAMWPSLMPAATKFDSLDLVRRIMMSQDMLFLSRQITYHISASTDVPQIWGDRDRLNQVFSRIIEHIVKRADRGSRIDIAITPFSLRGSPGIKIGFQTSDHDVTPSPERTIAEEMFSGKPDVKTGVSLYECRQSFIEHRGQMWIDVPKEYQLIYNVLLPASEDAARLAAADQQTYKYDISIINYANVRKRFGIRKSAHLVTQIEHYIRSLVRYPIDMVMSVGDKGLITTIYETQKGAAASVASRISQRLGKEEFRIGKRPVDLSFKYKLSKLNPEELRQSKPHEGRSH
jgi:hypothetical protein